MFIPLVAAKAGTQITNPEQAFLESRLRGNERLGLVHASRSLSLICGAAFVFAIAIPGAHSDASAEDATVTVFAAASLKNALDDVDQAFTRKSGVRVVASYAASSALIKQIENGAPADVFVSADLDWMDYGARHKLIKQDTRVDLLGNQLVLIAPKEAEIPLPYHPPQAENGRIGVLAPALDLARVSGDASTVTGQLRAVPLGNSSKAPREQDGVRAT